MTDAGPHAFRTGAAERAAMRGLLDGLRGALAGPLAPEWERAFWAVPRHRFLPERVWIDEDLTACTRGAAPDHWLRAAYANGPVVTAIDDGIGDGGDDTIEGWIDDGTDDVRDPGDGGRRASSSASAPSIVFRMLRLLAVEDGHRVLEIGTGTGWNAGLMAHRLGSERVTTVELDPRLSAQAARRLRSAGLEPRIITGDGAAGYAPGAPYDRVVATCSVRRVPGAWLEQTRPGGVILTPWESPWFRFGLLRLTVRDDGSASGRFSPHSAFTLIRNQRTDLRIYRDVVEDHQIPERSATRLCPWAVAGDDPAARFAIGLRLPDVWRAWHDSPDVHGVASRLWLATTDTTSWAAVDWDSRTDKRLTVWQYGPRRLWDEVEATYRWWLRAGSPGPERFGLTVTPDGRQTPWLHTPAGVLTTGPEGA
ncbi:protein-L-isoaspartate O-methyltransferase [Streptomyces sp. L-9-10]|uniref:methyltransferase domain-containing protein n=1 Tax=Streptomyces sp. L-9-10 TaxID=1478131 RepID=UPI0010D987D6|nr:methyltransferase domain-containing protein [Streptomyces sp. L-9-10]RYJ22593.1 protein-L-isoaspartate O-methyltransferase [Streptomyces sp. L-9-10]